MKVNDILSWAQVDDMVMALGRAWNDKSSVKTAIGVGFEATTGKYYEFEYDHDSHKITKCSELSREDLLKIGIKVKGQPATMKKVTKKKVNKRKRTKK